MEVEIVDYTNRCCSCFSSTSTQRSVRSDFNSDHTISSACLMLTGIDLLECDSSSFTENICLQCVEDLGKAFDFREKCLETQRKFSGLIGEEKEEVRDEVSEEIVQEEEVSAYICSVCNKYFSREIYLQKHMKEFHEAKTDLSCEICKETFRKRSKLVAHMVKHRKEKSFTCEECQKVYTTRSGWRKHRNLVHLRQETSAKVHNHLCSDCGKSFSTRQGLQTHNTTHTGEKSFSCSVCNKAFALANRLKAHMRVHTGERPYKCSDCGMSFSHRNVLVCHRRLHTGEKPFECSVCQKTFRQYATLKTHMAIHNGKPIGCPDCKKTFSRVAFLHVHQRKHTGEKPYACDRCPNRYRQKCHLDQHMDTHDGVKYQCEVCQKEYSKKWSLKVHMFSHGEGNRFQCSECGSTFVRRDKYKKHMKTCHGLDADADPTDKNIPAKEAIGESSKKANVIKCYSILERVRSRVSGWFSPTAHTERQGNRNGNLRRRRESDTEEPGEQSEAPPVKKLKSYIVTQTPVDTGADPRSLTSNFVANTSTPTTSGFGTHRSFLDYSNRPPEPYSFVRSSPPVHHPQKSALNEVVLPVVSEEAVRQDEVEEEEEEEEVEESIANGNDSASESGASMSSASVNIFGGKSGDGLRQSSVINFGSHLQSKKSLFSDKNISMSMSSLNSLSQKRSFNASLYGSTSALSDSRLLNIQSPFYRGRTMYGGASAYSAMRFNNPLRSRQMPSTRPSSSLSNFSSSSTSQLGGAQAAAPGGNRDEVPLSKTAKRIMEMMNQLTGPLSDVRKMAHSSLAGRQVPSLMQRQRFTEQDLQANRAIRLQTPKTPYSRGSSSNAAARMNSVPPMTELQVPSMSQLLQMKKLQSQTEQLRKCAMDSNSTLNRVTEYKLPDTKGDAEGAKHVNKMRNKISKVRPENSSAADDVAPEVKLPDVQLPQLMSVPKFDITFPAVVEKRNGPSEWKAEKAKERESTANVFKFSQPIVVGQTVNSTSSIVGSFKFCEPIDVREMQEVKSNPAVPMFTYAPELAKKRPQVTVAEKESPVKSPVPQTLKIGSSVLEALKTSPLKISSVQSEKTALETVKDPIPLKIVNSFGSQFKAAANTWECDACLVRNKETDSACVACGGAKKGASKPPAVPVATPAAPAMDSGFKALVAAQNAKWECPGCMLKNDNALQKCPCCESPRPDGALKTTPSTATAASSNPWALAPKVADEGFSKLVSQQKAKWECSACMTRNEAGKNRCACCDQAKPGAATDNVPQFSFSTVSSSSKFTFGMPASTAVSEKIEATSTVTTTTAGGFVFGGSSSATTTSSTTTTKESEKTVKEAPKSGFIFGNVASTASSVTQEPPKYIFGAPKAATTTAESPGKLVFKATTTVTTAVATTASTTVTSSTGGFKFGVPAPVTTAELPTTPKAPPAYTFGASLKPAESSPAASETSTSVSTTPKASIVFGTPAVTTSTTTNLFGSTTATASPFASSTDASSSLFKSPMTFGEAAAKAEPPKKIIEFGNASKASQPFTFGATTPAVSTSAPPAFSQSTVTTSALTNQPSVFAFGGASTAPAEQAKPQQTPFIFGAAAAKPQEEKPPQAAVTTPAASTGFGGFGGFGGQQQQTQNPPAFGSMATSPTFGAAATQSPFNSGMSPLNSGAQSGFGGTPAFGSTPSANLFGGISGSTANAAPSVFSASPATGQQPAASANIFGSPASKPAGVAMPFGGQQSRGFDVNDGIEPSTKKISTAFEFGAPKPAEPSNTLFTFGANNNNTQANQGDNKPAFNFSAGQAPNFNFTGSAQQNSNQPFSFNAAPSAFNFDGGSTETGTNAPAFSFGGTTNLFAVNPGQQPQRRKICRGLRRVQR
ncbi:nuclear pore complex protein Nup153 [Phlebotomus argentipes]|uniref:nuclear pore complex protein Nup153 n=1 Tax=Phlebotomus argentipes TaxID=94469 RepID=UPI002893424E|nr:nuclear pore complex protein Nup153 [Phlebotomus argentipes]